MSDVSVRANNDVMVIEVARQTITINRDEAMELMQKMGEEVGKMAVEQERVNKVGKVVI